MLKAIIFGAPGAGKGTYASRLQAKLGVDVISMGDIFRELVKEQSELSSKVKSYMEKGSLVPDDVVVEVLKGHLAKISKGKGFQGVMKRHNYAGGPATHGSTFYRAPGSIGASSFPSRVWKNKGMPGHMGSERVSVKNLKVIDVRVDQNLLLILGAVPGAKGTYLEIRKES